MEKLQMCRICLAENVRMYVVVNKDLRELYEKLTDIPFVTADRRPILACFFCCAKLKQCCRLMRKCLEADELFAQIMDEDYEPNPLINPEHFEVFGGFTTCPIEYISIVGKCQTKSIAIKEELPDDCHDLEDITEPQEDSLSIDLKPENTDNSCLDLADTPPHHSESDPEVDVPLIDKSAGEEALEVSKKKERAVETNSARVTRRTKLEDTITAELKKNEPSNLTVFRTTRNRTSKPGTFYKEPDECYQRSLSKGKELKQHTQTLIIKKRHKCDVCQCSFGEKSHLTTHIRIHTGEKPYKCDVCQRRFRRKGDLTQHIRIHTGEKPYKCDVCQRSFSRKGHLTTHIRIHTGEKPYKCDVCQRRFSQKGDLTQHILVHTGVKPYKCDVCQRSFNRKSILKTHNILKHTGAGVKTKTYKCDVCQRSFSGKGHLTTHIRIHTGEKPYECDVCQRRFSRKDDLTQHILVHTGIKPYKCDVCQRSFNRKSILKKHNILKHTSAGVKTKTYKCDVCQRSFSGKGHLTTHIRTHTFVKHYECDVCKRRFSRKGYLTQHIPVHTGAKPYKCDVCQHSFSRKVHLTRHIRIHTGEKPYKCDVCQRRFRNKTNLKKSYSNTHWCKALRL